MSGSSTWQYTPGGKIGVYPITIPLGRSRYFGIPRYPDILMFPDIGAYQDIGVYLDIRVHPGIKSFLDIGAYDVLRYRCIPACSPRAIYTCLFVCCAFGSKHHVRTMSLTQTSETCVLFDSPQIEPVSTIVRFGVYHKNGT